MKANLPGLFSRARFFKLLRRLKFEA